MEKKVEEVEGQASEFWENIKKEEAGLRQTIREYEENYVSGEEHAAVLGQREELIMRMKEKLEEYEGVIEEN